MGQDHHCQRDYLTVPTIFKPHVEILPSKDKAGISASTDLASRTLYDALDLLEFGRKPEAATEGTYQNIRGMIGERILSLLMEHFLLSFRENLFSRLDEMIEREILTRVLIWNSVV